MDGYELFARHQAIAAAREAEKFRQRISIVEAVKIQRRFRGWISRKRTLHRFHLDRLEAAREAWEKHDTLDMGFLEPRRTAIHNLSMTLGREVAGEELDEAAAGLDTRLDDKLHKEDFITY